jgi:hypothetical protein
MSITTERISTDTSHTKLSQSDCSEVLQDWNPNIPTSQISTPTHVEPSVKTMSPSCHQTSVIMAIRMTHFSSPNVFNSLTKSLIGLVEWWFWHDKWRLVYERKEDEYGRGQLSHPNPKKFNAHWLDHAISYGSKAGIKFNSKQSLQHSMSVTWWHDERWWKEIMSNENF